MSKTQHTITALVQNEAGTLNRLVSMFRRRGFSLASMNAGDCEQQGLSRVTIVVNGDDNQLYQCVKQLDKLIDVIEACDLKPNERVVMELALIRVEPENSKREELKRLLAEHMARIAREDETSITVEQSADVQEIENFIKLLEPFNVVEIVRTGPVAIRTK